MRRARSLPPAGRPSSPAPDPASQLSPAVAAVVRLQRLVGNQVVARQYAPTAGGTSELLKAVVEKLDRGDSDGAARACLEATDDQIKTVVKAVEESQLRALRTAADRVGGEQSHRVRTPVLNRELTLALGRDEWDEYARLLNAFNDTDIRIKVYALANDPEVLGSVRKATDRVNGASSFRIRAPILERQYTDSLASGVWGDAAGYLNGFNDDDITKKFLPQLAEAQLKLIYQGAVDRGHKRLVPLVAAEFRKRTNLPLDYDLESDDPANPGQTNLTLHDERQSADYLDNRVQGAPSAFISRATCFSSKASIKP